jgi:glycolate oxidase
MKMPGIDQAVIARRAAIAERLRRIVGREWVLDSESERRPYECDGLTAYSALPLLVVLPETTEQVSLILQFCNANTSKWCRAAPVRPYRAAPCRSKTASFLLPRG